MNTTDRNEFYIPVENGRVHAYAWQVEQPRAVLLCVHGLAEHGRRYAELAGYLNRHRITVVAYDHRGHGDSRRPPDSPPGFVASRRGWQVLLQDLENVRTAVQGEHPGIPMYILGHSMGSFVTRCHLAHSGRHYQGAILSATGTDPGLKLRIGLLLARLTVLLRGASRPSRLLDHLTFGAFGSRFRPLQTRFDWLSRDPDEVERYLQDPLCGFVASSSLFYDLATGVKTANSAQVVSGVPTRLPLLFIAGDHDPVGNFGTGFHQVVQAYRRHGAEQVTELLYSEGRHEMLHEVNRQEVFADILEWVYSTL
ncbi:alpha/beta fold hydrolase [Spirochaeta africana]|uniref:Lysophospholipase n=1 Tax=Spirochaeta africana (strain ATCC 700263 / DSM 8902 / Z-7692) TaxID=889378 RepID=H9UI57_SPIAZ|nr:alpha/beta hydrolase [Spirochaeta africana]AFG37200.1 lysophospholipase [Spirochaeta africana DSM 8902]